MAAGDISDALMQEVLDHQFNATRYTNRIYTWLDKAQKDIVRRTNIRTAEETATLNVSANAATAALPSDFAREISVTRLDTGATLRAPLQQLNLQTYDGYYDSSKTGTIYAYAVSESNLLLLPKTNAAVTLYLRYWQIPATITTSVDPVIPSDYHTLLIDYALFRAYASEHDRSSSQYHKKLYDEALFQLQGQAQSDHNADQVVVVGGTWSNVQPLTDIPTIP